MRTCSTSLSNLISRGSTVFANAYMRRNAGVSTGAFGSFVRLQSLAKCSCQALRLPHDNSVVGHVCARIVNVWLRCRWPSEPGRREPRPNEKGAPG